MTGNSGIISPEPDDRSESDPRRSGRVSFLDQALWKKFSEAQAPEDYLTAWLALQCRLVPGGVCAVVVLGEPDSGAFAPAAFWPEEAVVSSEISVAAEMALAERRGIVRGQESGQAEPAKDSRNIVAYPIVIEGKLYGSIAVELAGRTTTQLRGVMRQLQWGASWIEVLLYRQRAEADHDQLDQVTAALDLVVTALEHKGFNAACSAAVMELATRLDCNQVSVGFMHRGRVRVVSYSHTAEFGRRMNLIRDIGAAMDEAVDQGSIILYPPASEDDAYVMKAHVELARAHSTGPVLTVPMTVEGLVLGAVTFELPEGQTFDQATIELCDCAVSVIGPLLEEKRLNDRLVLWKVAESIVNQLKRLFGPRYFGRKLAMLFAAGAIAFFSVAKGEYRITSPASLRGLVQRSVVAPFDGYVASQNARAGETVREGQVLAILDDKDLVLERLRWSTTRSQKQTEHSRALATRERADASIAKTQIEQAEAQIALLDAQIARTRLVAPFDGLLVQGDLSQSVGSSVRRGDELFKIAPLNSYRIVLEVDEYDITDVQVGQTGMLLVSSLPDEAMAYRIELLTPVAEAREGRNFFNVEARLDIGGERLRPGMGGIAKTHVEERLLIWIWTRKVITWGRVKLWEFWP